MGRYSSITRSRNTKRAKRKQQLASRQVLVEEESNERVITDLKSLKILVDTAVSHSLLCPKCALTVTNKSWTNLELLCTVCNFSANIRKDNPLNHELPLEEALVIGSYCGGIGFNAVKFLLNASEIEMIHKKTFISAEERVGPLIQNKLNPELVGNIEEEKRLALEDNDFHLIGELKIPYITVIVDGGWSKRSYGHSFNSNSGCAVIIGARTKKVLYVGFRVKTCSICDNMKNEESPPNHMCHKNWLDSAQSMEASIIVSGFQESYEIHGVLYKYVIGDADSSVYAHLQSQIVYPGRIPIEKIDCANHAVRGLNTKIYSIVNNTTFTKADRELITKHINRFGKDMRAAISYNSAHRFSTDPAIKTSPVTLATDISNIPAHIYGDHSKCKKYFCKGGGENCYNQFKSSPAGKQLLECFDRMAHRAPRLIYNTTSNLAESFMAIAAKYISGKRVNYGQCGSYARRIQAAVLAYNNGAFWPLKRLSNLENGCKIWNKTEKYFTTAKRRSKIPKPKSGPFGRCSNKKPTSKDQNHYGPSALQGILLDTELSTAVDNLIAALQVTSDMQHKIQSKTVGQIYNDEWKLQRRNRLTASNAGKIFKMRNQTNNRSSLQAILYPRDLSGNENIIRGINLEPAAKSVYSFLYDTEVSECGLFVSLENGVLGASPDGLIGTDGILEIKCPNCRVEDVPIRKDKFLVITDGNMQLNRKHRYYYQVIMQLYVTGKSFCDFFVYFENPGDEAYSYFRERIVKDPQTDALWNTMKEKLIKFYTCDMAPEIVSPMFPNNNRFRTPDYRKNAQTKTKSKK